MVTARPAAVLVGHDGSESAQAALAWALDYAAATGAHLRILRGWTMARAPQPPTMTPGYVPPIEDFEAAVLDRLGRDIEPVVNEYGPDVEISLSAARGAPANSLIAASHEADLLVVGARGLGGFKGLALGSVSDQCIRHSACPVVVVRSEHSSLIERSAEADEDRARP